MCIRDRDEECELVTIYYGADVPGHEAEARREQVQEQYPDKEIELQYGGQPIYYLSLIHIFKTNEETDFSGLPLCIYAAGPELLYVL